jgi:Arc/MetJ-type ribon-helix-helix transcriptional regulator
MRTRATMTISLPKEMIREVERIRKTEHRTRSELIREALRVYMGQAGAQPRSVPVYSPTPLELRAIAKGRAQMKRGDSYTIDELFDAGLARPRRPARAKIRRARA